MSRVLVVDDEGVIRRALRKMLERHGYTVTEAQDIDTARQALCEDFDVAMIDVRLPDGEGTELLPDLAQTPAIVMTSYASVRSAVSAMRAGAFDYISKPFDHDEMLLVIERAIQTEQLQRQNSALKQDLSRSYPIGGMIGRCSAMRQVFSHINKIAPVDMTVLITGESGTGKELVARALHEHSRRSNSPLIAVNCSAIPESLLESELFGHQKGAFDGALEKRKGVAEAAHRGTLFLDEIGELSLAAQARLLRLLEDSEIRPMGSAYSRRVDIRLVAATHHNLVQLVTEGQFREDLFYRLRVMEINLPPLRARGEDIQDMAKAFVERACRHLGVESRYLSDAALEAIDKYHWPGNVRELENAVERAVILSDTDSIQPPHLGLLSQMRPHTTGHGHSAELSLDDYFRHFVITHQISMNETALAERLGISRKALWERRQRMDLPRSKT